MPGLTTATAALITGMHVGWVVAGAGVARGTAVVAFVTTAYAGRGFAVNELATAPEGANKVRLRAPVTGRLRVGLTEAETFVGVVVRTGLSASGCLHPLARALAFALTPTRSVETRQRSHELRRLWLRSRCPVVSLACVRILTGGVRSSST